ncbi:MAG: C-GCAxxG-C-C family protein [Mangrovibacterium sp.]
MRRLLCLPKDKTYEMIQEFSDRFLSLHGAIDCRTLLGCDLRTEEGQQHLKKHQLHEAICEGCIRDALKITDGLMHGYQRNSNAF